jgi:hypothetical protein
MTVCLISLLFLAAYGQSAPVAAADNCLMNEEKERLKTETNLDRRIRIFEAGSRRCESSVVNFITRGEFQYCPGTLQAWRGLLEQSLQDIHSRPGRKDKSRALIRYEIHLRRAIAAVRDARVKAPLELLQGIDEWIDRAEEIRKDMVKILFPASE